MAKVKFVFIGIDEMTDKLQVRAVPASVVTDSAKFERWCEKEQLSSNNSILLSECQLKELMIKLEELYGYKS